jgi:endo-1,3-1,4-beta-glycanase ExoK
MKLKHALAAAALLSTPAYAQQIPFFKSPGVIDQSNWYISNGWSDGAWNACWWKPAQITPDGTNLKFSIASKADFKGIVNDIPTGKFACGELQSMTQQSYGLYEVNMKTAAGSGLNTAFFTYTSSPVWDEIDLEFLGLHPTQLSINYFTNGVNASLKPINLGFDASQAFHTYGLLWLPTGLTWYVDGKLVYRTQAAAKIPSHLSRMYPEFWAGAAAENGWLGAFKYSAPVSAEYAWVSFLPSTNPHVVAMVPATK